MAIQGFDLVFLYITGFLAWNFGTEGNYQAVVHTNCRVARLDSLEGFYRASAMISAKIGLRPHSMVAN
jgi:hypothetical protein